VDSGAGADPEAPRPAPLLRTDPLEAGPPLRLRVIAAEVTNAITTAPSTATFDGRCLMVITCSDGIRLKPGAGLVGGRTGDAWQS